MTEFKFTIDGKECGGRTGQTILEAAAENGVYIPALCRFEGLKPTGSCRVCTVRVGGRYMAACTQPVTEGMAVENTAPDLEDMRKALIEMLFVEGNHMCPTCEKSGNCELQALAYRYGMMAPRFPFQWPVRETDGSDRQIIMEHNRCIQCHRCVAAIESESKRKVFCPQNRSVKTSIKLDRNEGAAMTGETAKKAMDVCPVGAILKKETGFAVPIGKRRFDHRPIGSEIEEKAGKR